MDFNELIYDGATQKEKAQYFLNSITKLSVKNMEIQRVSE
jgi:hypothetical protein